MTLEQILEKMATPEKLVDPKEINEVVSAISGFITHYEQELDEAKIKYSFKWEEVKYTILEGKKPLTDKQTEILMMRDDAYKHLNETKRRLSELKRYRADLNSKLSIILGTRRGY